MTDDQIDTSADTTTSSVSRRVLLGGGAALGVGLTALGAPSAAAQPSVQTGHPRGGASVAAALRFLQGVTDAYRTSGPRLAQSYYDESGLRDTGFIYDNALTIIALLAGGDVGRARAIGDALLSAQNTDSEADGRLRQAYQVNAFAASEFGLSGTAVGDMSWTGIALAQLARRTRPRRNTYLAGALRIADWIETETRTETGLGGYDFGETPGLDGFKSAEHNIDVYAFFSMIAELTGQQVWRARAQHAWDFVTRMWNADDGFFFTGSNDGSTVNTSPTQRPLDVQTWAWLAARRNEYASALDWAKTNLAVTDTPQRTNSTLIGNYTVSGVAFGSGSLKADTETPIDPYHGGPDTGAVWFEGTAQLALSLRDRRRRGDVDDAETLIRAIVSAQRRLGQGQTFNGKAIPGGIVAASSPLNTGFGFGYYQHLHIGATSWYVMAGTRSNPYRFLR